MKACNFRNCLRLACAAAMLLEFAAMTGTQARATEVWNGPLVSFAVPAGADWTQPANQDRIAADVWLARGTTRGLFNAASEGSYASFFSPSNTVWAYGALADYASLTYASWETWNGHNPPSMVGQDAVLHLLSDDIYLSINFSFWGGSGGGFSYMRSTAPGVPEPSVASIALIGLAMLRIPNAGSVGIKTKRGRSGGKTGNEFGTKQK
jgi:hypothetical protein